MNTTLFVANINYQITPQELRELFEKHGLIRSVHIAVDDITGRSRGFAFVECETKRGAEQCKSALNKHKFGNREIIIKWAKKKD